jgi:mono/diheme cytochrome c family protein
MKQLSLKLMLTITGFMFISSGHPQEGRGLFQTHCTACHTIGKGKLVGPDLINIVDKQSREWLVAFIQSSQKVIKSGDQAAQAIYLEFNKIPMPDQPLTDQHAMAILDYIASISKTASAGNASSITAETMPDLLAGTSAANIQQGLLLFTGKQRLTNHGPSCAACHKVKDDRVFTSGILAKELTQSFEILGSAGVAAILRNPPFPVMKAAFEKYPLTENEVVDLTAYLKSVSNERIYQHPRDYSSLFGISGMFVFVLILTGIHVLYVNRKKLAVNHDIYRRQNQTCK